ncbi:hypothetical protein [Sedimentibacter sp.]|uniref:hypothetical protein n=1 Tax=Sedimentibacter sp. TaxID=1960295 RepID=UPI0028990F0A|nr:hypothetical protein [Sedimentibacter sp.]
MIRLNIAWNFPNNGCGQTRGISDAGIETFTGTEIQSLAREICQNSLDAAQEDTSLEVVVEFERYRIQSNDIPGYETYKSKLNKAYNYWSNRKSEKTISYLKKAIKAIQNPTTYVLRISDYNTTGLVDPYGDSDDGWNALTKIDGGATKTGDKAGAFGIGKNAPFCNSDYRLVFYRTLNAENEIAAQGVSRFISFPENETDALRTMTTGFGYYGNTDGNLPVETITELDDLQNRTAVGTDVFVYGFNASTTWEDDVTCEALENFLMAIHKNKLTVFINTRKINATNLPALMEIYKTKARQSYCYYKVLSSPETKVFTKDFHGLGKLKLSVLVDAKEKLNRKVLVTRTSGMKLLTIGNISRLISFSGLLEMQGKELNEYFREMETPSHDKWVPGRYTNNPVQAKEYHDELKQWVREIILGLGEYSSDEEIEVEGLSSVLQKESSSETQNSDSKKEDLHNTIGDILILPRTISQGKPKGLFHGNEGEGQSNSRDTQGNVGQGGFPATRTLGGNRQRSKKYTHRGTVSQGGRDIVHEKYSGDTYQPLKNIRIMKIENGKFKASFEVPRDVRAGHIEIVTVGENGKFNKLQVRSVTGISACENVKCSSIGISFFNLKGNEKVVIEFSLVDSRDYAMEVNVYEHN